MSSVRQNDSFIVRGGRFGLAGYIESTYSSKITILKRETSSEISGGFLCSSMGLFRFFRSLSGLRKGKKDKVKPSDAVLNEENPIEGHPRYQRLGEISSGTFGFVIEAFDKTKEEHVAIKFLSRGDKIQLNVEREILNHKALRHPHVVQFKEVFLTDKYLAIVMEYADSGDLFKYVRENGRLREDVARWIFQQLIFGLDYCHRKGVASRDIKLENVLLQSGARRPLVKLCDFGYSKHEELDSAPTSRVGTPDYMSPEILKSRGGSYDAKIADLWSCGVVLFVMVVGEYPFSNKEDSKLRIEEQHTKVLKRILEVEYTIPSFVSPPCADLIRRLLNPDPSKRISIKEIMKHPWHKIGLPPSAAEMNDVYLTVEPNNFQSDQDIKEIVRASMKSSDIKPLDSDHIFDSSDFGCSFSSTDSVRDSA